MDDGWTRAVSGLDVVGGALVIAFETGHGANERHVGEDVSGAFETGGQLNAFD